jgi:hypothetical protein
MGSSNAVSTFINEPSGQGLRATSSIAASLQGEPSTANSIFMNSLLSRAQSSSLMRTTSVLSNERAAVIVPGSHAQQTGWSTSWGKFRSNAWKLTAKHFALN